ncbi:hypothetical protein [Bythopirellula polymerisocia]|uniref:Uncharacterized protein n=1 Tax=Bythopirellula polymerisocia TaxID=2528003 RepID=A0A5C6D155_9BACT|nr:hypothetical protein [Bythopirellula polymerisocia]TWU29387.1 hypothetical protein Pla144_01650 [Bythopirellula polymerisocia]
MTEPDVASSELTDMAPYLSDCLQTDFQNDNESKIENLPGILLRARLTPLDAQNRPASPLTVVVTAIDEHTIVFNHFVPLTAKQAIVTFEKQGMSTYSVEVELTWCRFDERHRYTSGGRFVMPLGRTA